MRARGAEDAARARRAASRPEGGAAGFGGALVSARDRRRVRERNAAERERVERALAEAPLEVTPRPKVAAPAPTFDRVRQSAPAPAIGPLAGQVGCPVCGGAKLASDEVFVAGGTLRLVECLHCDHRFTSRPRSRWSELGARMATGAVGAMPRKRGRHGRRDPADAQRGAGRGRGERPPAAGAGA